MTHPRNRRLLTLLAAAGALAVVVLGGVYWQDIAEWVRFYRLFEPLGKNDQGLPEYRHRQTRIVMVRVPGGTFLMGTSTEEVERMVAEFGEEMEDWLEAGQPQHEVTLSPFMIAKYEVTQEEWLRVMDEQPSYFEGDNRPVETVAWEDCKEFSRKTGLSLPTEAQWEYACRAGTTGSYAGTGNLRDMGWYGNSDGNTGTHPVGRKRPNAFGLFDMHGNVSEWCEDVYDGTGKFYSKPEAVGPDPVCSSGSEARVFRGGGWHDVDLQCRSAHRPGGSSPSLSNFGLGFRPAFSPRPVT